jgi:hypothetical protein
MKIRFNLNKILFIVSKKSFISRKTIGKMEIIHCTNIEISFTHGKIPEKKKISIKFFSLIGSERFTKSSYTTITT